jgi:hypothetical protein
MHPLVSSKNSRWDRDMDLTTSKGRGQLGLRVAPRCRGAASSMLRLSHAAPSVFGGLSRGSSVAQRLTQSLAMLPMGASAGSDSDCEASAAPASALGPFITRLWPSASFGRDALWQDTLVALD